MWLASAFRRPIPITTRLDSCCVHFMSIRFAGSRSVHERRRRRLSQESDAAAGGNTRGAAPAAPLDAATGTSHPDAFEHSPLHSVIRPQIWIHWCVVTLCVGCWAGMLYVGDLAEQTDFGLKSILGIRSGRLANFFSTIMLLWAGQLALLIYWYRRKSRNDFHGRYRLWLWAGVTLQFFLAVVATKAHLPFGDYMQRMWPVNVPQYALLCWLIPVATISLAMFKLLGMEMRNSPCSQFLLWVAGLSGVVAGMSLVAGSLLPERVSGLLQVGSATLAHLGLATALLFHARYVIHFSNEPPAVSRKTSVLKQVRAGLMSRLRLSKIRLRMPRLRLPRRRTGDASPAKVAVAKETSTKLTPRKVSASPRRQRKPVAQPPERPTTKQTPAGNSPSNSASSAKASNTQESSSAARRGPAPASSTPKHRIDAAETLAGPKGSARTSATELATRIENGDPLDETPLSGLSKKERRRLRKLQRDASRKTASAR